MVACLVGGLSPERHVDRAEPVAELAGGRKFLNREIRKPVASLGSSRLALNPMQRPKVRSKSVISRWGQPDEEPFRGFAGVEDDGGAGLLRSGFEAGRDLDLPRRPGFRDGVDGRRRMCDPGGIWVGHAMPPVPSDHAWPPDPRAPKSRALHVGFARGASFSTGFGAARFWEERRTPIAQTPYRRDGRRFSGACRALRHKDGFRLRGFLRWPPPSKAKLVRGVAGKGAGGWIPPGHRRSPAPRRPRFAREFRGGPFRHQVAVLDAESAVRPVPVGVSLSPQRSGQAQVRRRRQNRERARQGPAGGRGRPAPPPSPRRRGGRSRPRAR